MTRPLETATKNTLDGTVLPLAAIIRLDILGDPLLCWSGIGDLVFGASETGDTALDGNTFLGTADVLELGIATDGVGGSDAMEISLAGVDITDPILRQTIYYKNKWQFRQAWVWMVLFDPDSGAISGKPFRIKTGRMDRMPYSEGTNGGVVKCRIEGQQSYGDQPLYTRYSEQKDIDANDISQDWTYSLMNATAAFGKPSATTPISSTPGGGWRSDYYSDIRGFR